MIKRINNVLEFLENSANNFPDKIAFADEGNSVTYAELTAKAKRMAVGISKKNGFALACCRFRRQENRNGNRLLCVRLRRMLLCTA